MKRETFLQAFGHIADAPDGVGMLRLLILELAVHGRLTESSPEDEPVTDFLIRVAAERDRLAAAAIRKPTPQASPGRDIPFPIRSTWTWRRLGNITYKLVDGSHNPPRGQPRGRPMLSARNISTGIVRFDLPTRLLSDDDFNVENRRTAIAEGDLLMCIVGTVGGTAIVPPGCDPFVVQRSVAVIRTGLTPGYLKVFLDSPTAHSFYEAHSRGSAQNGLYLGKLALMPIAVPPIQEQHRIAERVDELMDTCDRLEDQRTTRASARSALTAAALHTVTGAGAVADLRARVRAFADHIGLHLAPGEGDLAALDRIRQTILDLAARGRLSHQDPTDEPATALIDRITSERARLVRANAIRKPKPVAAMPVEDLPFAAPPGWRWCRLGELLVTPLANGRSVPSRDDGFPVLRLTAMRGELIDLGERKGGDWTEDQARSYLVEGGDVFVARGSGSLGLVGRASRVAHDPELDRVAYPDTMIRIQPPRDAVDSAFLTLLWNSPLVRNQVELKARTTAGIYKVSQDDLRDVMLPVPPFVEQGRIVRRVAELSALCDDLESQLTAARALRSDIAVSVVAHAVKGRDARQQR